MAYNKESKDENGNYSLIKILLILNIFLGLKKNYSNIERKQIYYEFITKNIHMSPLKLVDSLLDAISIENRTNLNKFKMQFDLSELSSVRRIYQGHSYDIPSIVFMLQDGHTWPNLYFHKGGSKEFLQELKTFYIFKK